jgi:hypothetical protein
MERKVLAVDNRNLHLILNKSVKEWESQYGGDCDLWNMPLEELLDGTLEINDTIWYYYIDGRCYETTEYVEDMGRGLSEATKSLIETAHKSLCSAYNRSKLDGCPTTAVDNLSRLCDEISNLY